MPYALQPLVHASSHASSPAYASYSHTTLPLVPLSTRTRASQLCPCTHPPSTCMSIPLSCYTSICCRTLPRVIGRFRITLYLPVFLSLLAVH
ncbi:hypothetical protein L227DRAFT_295730 [Lentinus tigrinus ALCF2SS1-6]|uniref:Uncharacterized protein n=1 Tax=Lentinus tigrinus ALCF2SS1-6 TaxID=1328759 RepID=A0A5C2RXT1_9APHY|nr:hypothetical protein L227DRAFT_295730 [Lentinus tigrinus ALCF2SS1-6]